MNMQIKTKWIVESVTENTYCKTPLLRAAYGNSKNAEDNQFSAATPNGTLSMDVTNPETKDLMKPGQKWYATWELCEDQS